MTTCQLITKPITRMVDEGKSIDEIADSVCPTIKYGRAKIIRVIKDFLGEDYLIAHAETLKYDTEKAKLARTKVHKKIDAIPDDDNKPEPKESKESDNLISVLQTLLKKYSIEEIKKALSEIGGL